MDEAAKAYSSPKAGVISRSMAVSVGCEFTVLRPDHWTMRAKANKPAANWP